MIQDLQDKARRVCQWLALGLAVALGVVLSWIWGHREELTESDEEKAAKERSK